MLKGNWKRILSEDRLRRSSHVLSVLDNTVCIFGGEVQPRQPVDNQVDIVSLKSGRTSPTIHANMVLQLRHMQMRPNSRPSRSPWLPAPAWEVHQPHSMAGCTSSPAVAAQT